jgi:hypothetical protein
MEEGRQKRGDGGCKLEERGWKKKDRRQKTEAGSVKREK